LLDNGIFVITNFASLKYYPVSKASLNSSECS